MTIQISISINEMMQTVFVKSLPAYHPPAFADYQDDNNSGLQAGLLALDRCIMSFVANPLFKQPNVVDAQLASKARRDLNLIIRLSKQLKTRLADQATDSTRLGAH